MLDFVIMVLQPLSTNLQVDHLSFSVKLNLLAMASNLLAMASNIVAMTGLYDLGQAERSKETDDTSGPTPVVAFCPFADMCRSDSACVVQ